MIKAQFLKGQDFLGFDIIKKIRKRHIRKPPPPKRQNDVIKDKTNPSLQTYHCKYFSKYSVETTYISSGDSLLRIEPIWAGLYL